MSYVVSYVCKDNNRSVSYAFASRALADRYAGTVKGAVVTESKAEAPAVSVKNIPEGVGSKKEDDKKGVDR